MVPLVHGTPIKRLTIARTQTKELILLSYMMITEMVLPQFDIFIPPSLLFLTGYRFPGYIEYHYLNA